jgi:hypothetical protein
MKQDFDQRLLERMMAGVLVHGNPASLIPNSMSDEIKRRLSPPKSAKAVKLKPKKVKKSKADKVRRAVVDSPPRTSLISEGDRPGKLG